MEVKFPELRAELVESLDDILSLAHEVREFADTRPEWQDDEDDCLLAAHSASLHALNAVRHVKDVLEEVP